ncbi:AI-2E family transporter [Cognatitamlana onchidii]|uniref:AI-2E family transporter n=1 Tax=Cognatitamlana onchidii TaxID=2562860 RepID=UPI0010A5F498|nr:AI-2E family transporter [Algibacter onchidii]
MNNLKTDYTINTFIKIVVLSGIIIWSFFIAKPFLMLIVWSILVAVALYPLYLKALNMFKEKRKGLVTGLFVGVLLLLIVMPTLSIAGSIIDSSKEIFHNFEQGTLKVPPPSTSVKDWPLLGNKIYDLWSSASSDLEKFILKNPDAVKSSVGWFFSSFAGIMGAALLSLVAIIIAGIFLSNASSGYETAVAFSNKLVSGKGKEIIDMCINTIRSVVKGILLVAIIQAVLAFVGFSMMDFATSGILAFAVLVFAVVQVPVIIVMIPAIVYVFSNAETTPAILFSIYMIVVALLDNVLKPLLLAKGLQTPMIVILIGAIGGMMLQGILGLFVGPVVLAIGHSLYSKWVSSPS